MRIRQFLAKKNIAASEQLPNSPDLTQCGCALFPKLRHFIKETRSPGRGTYQEGRDDGGAKYLGRILPQVQGGVAEQDKNVRWTRGGITSKGKT